MKKILALVLALVMVLCAASALADGIKVGIINLDPAESGYREANVKDMTDTFTAENGYDASFVTAPTADKQLDAARGFIADGVKYILVSAADADGWDEVLQEAKDAGIGVFLFDRMVNADPSLYTAAVVSDMNVEGETAVAWLESLGLEEYKILHIKGQLGSAAQLGRSGALTEKCEADETGRSFTKAPAETAGILKKPARSLRLRSTPAKTSTSSTLRMTAWPTALWKLWTRRASPTVWTAM